MSFQLFVEMPGGDKVVDTAKKIEDGLDRDAAAAGRARDALGRFMKTTTDAGETAAKAGDKAAAGHDKAKKAADGHGDALTNVIHAVEAYIAIHQVERILDGYIEIRNKINSVSESQDNLTGLMEATFRIAQETRTEWEALASTYQRVANAGRGLGISQQQILDLTEELSMGLRLSGSNSREAMMTMMELTHAFTVGTLTGREFRVMMKDAPALMHELQVASGHTGAEFAEMGKHGKFTAQALIEWFDKAKGAIKDKFGQTIPTIHEGFTLIKNAAEKFFGEAAVGTGVMGKLGETMRYVAEHFEGIAKVALAVGEALIGLFVIEKIIALVRALTVAVAANPLGAILTAITVGIALLRQFGDELQTHERIWSNVDGQFVTVGDHLRALWSMIKDLGAAIVDFTENAWHGLMAAFSGGVDTTGIELSLRNVLTLIAAFVDAAIGLLRFLGHSVTTIFGGIPVTLTEMLVDALRAVVGVVQDAVNAVIDAVNKLIEAKNWVQEKLTGEKVPVNQQRQAAMQWADETNKKFGLGPYAPQIGPGLDAEAVRQQRLTNQGRAIQAGVRLSDYDVGPGGPGAVDQYVRYPDLRASALYAPGGAGSERADNLIKHVDLDVKNPYEGGASAILQKFKDDWDADIKGTNVTKDMVSSFMDELDKRAHDEAAKRVMSQKGPGTVSSVKGIADEKPVDEKELKALEKLKNELRTVLEASNPVVAAQEKLAHAQDIVNKAVDKGILSWAEGATAMENYRRKEADALDPVGAWTRKQIEAAAALRDTVQAQEHAAQVLAFENEMKKAGVVVTEQQIAAASHLLSVQTQRAAQMRAEQQIMEAIQGPARDYELALGAAGDLLRRGRINAEQYSRAIDNIREAYLAAKPGAKSFLDGMESAWLQMKKGADDFGASLATLVADDLDKLNDAIVTAANGGEVAWDQMADAMIQDLERLLLKMLEIRLIQAGMSLFGGGGDVVPGITAPVTSPSQVARTMPVAYPTAAAASAASAAPAPPLGPVIVHVHNHYDQSVAHAAIDSRRGQTQVVNVLRANPGAVRSLTGTRR